MKSKKMLKELKERTSYLWSFSSGYRNHYNKYKICTDPGRKAKLRKELAFDSDVIVESLTVLLYYDISYDDLLAKIKSYEPKDARIIDAVYQKKKENIAQKVKERKTADVDTKNIRESAAIYELRGLRDTIAGSSDTRPLWDKFGKNLPKDERKKI